MNEHVKSDTILRDEAHKLIMDAYEKGRMSMVEIFLYTADQLVQQTPDLAPYGKFVAVLAEGILKQIEMDSLN